MRGHIIGLTGRAGSGKSTVAEMISEIRGDWMVVSEGIADRLKISAARSLGMDASDRDLIKNMESLKIDGSVSWEMGPHGGEMTGRRYLQLYGTEAHRDIFGSDFWIDQILPDPNSPTFGREDEFDLLVLTDVRYENEVKRIWECGGDVWMIHRSEVDPLPGNHRSESFDLVPDVDMMNDGSLDDLRRAVERELSMWVSA